MSNVFKDLFFKASGKDEERKINILGSIVERNKIMNSGVDSIDDVVAFSKSCGTKHDLYL